MNRRTSTNPSDRDEAPRLRRIAAAVAAAVYLFALAGFLFESVLGDSRFLPLSYFFKWDMFTANASDSVRRIAVGRTSSGRYVQIVPSPLQQFRAGAHSDLTRIELDRRGVFNRAVVEQALSAAAQRPDDPIERVFLFEKYWPDKFSYPDALYRKVWGSPKPDRVAWRLLDEFSPKGGE